MTRVFRHAVLLVTLGCLGFVAPCAGQSQDRGGQEPGDSPQATQHEAAHVVQQRGGRPAPSPAAEARAAEVAAPGQAGSSRPTETLSLNFEKVSASAVAIAAMYQERNRLYARGTDNRLYGLADGTYRHANGAEIRIQSGTLASKARPDMVLKGQKIDQNAPPQATTEPVRASAGAGWEPIRIRKRATAGAPAPSSGKAEKTWRAIVILTSASVEDGRYEGPGGAWLEAGGGRIATLGGALEAHQPPPYFDVDGDGSVTFQDPR